MKRYLKKAVPLLYILPFVIGSIGYRIAGETITDSMYAGLLLYFVSCISDSYNIWIEIGRWTAPLVTATAILTAFKSIGNRISWWIKCRSGNSVAVYSDTDINVLFDERTKVIYPGCQLQPAADSHIILFSSDMENLKFYEEHEEMLENKAVYMGVREIEYGFIKGDDPITFFDINGSIARSLWKRIGLWRRQQEEVTVVIYGNGALSENVLNYGLLLNLYSKEQKITYYLISSDQIHQIKHQGMPLLNRDEIIYCSQDSPASWRAIRKADVLVLTEKLPTELLQTICVISTKGTTYYYSPDLGGIEEYLEIPDLKLFGKDEELFTDDNIRQEKLIQKAKELNLHYARLYGGEKDWNRLTGFLRLSNISSADYTEVLSELMESGYNTDMEELAELEHIRWCRFHYLNYWLYGIPENGKNKDEKLKIHKCLIDYKDLREEDKEKDRATVRAAGGNIWDIQC